MHGKLKERASGGSGPSQLFPPVISAVQQSIVLVTVRIPRVFRHDGGDNLNFPAPDAGFYRPKKHVIKRTGIGGLDSGESQVRVK